MKKMMKIGLAAILLGLPVAGLPGLATAQDLTVYSGRGEALVGQVIKQFEKETGLKVEVRYGGTAELATLLVEEGDKSPADVFWAQDGGALGAVNTVFAKLPAEVNGSVLPVFRNADNNWVATSGRTRTLVYSKDRVKADDLPASIKDLANEKYKGRVGFAPTNGSFQAFVTALRVAEGDDAARNWLKGLIANDAKKYRNNGTQIEAIANGEIDFGLVNNYYLGRYLANDAKFPVAQTGFGKGDIGNLVNVAGVGIVEASDNKDGARRFIDYLLSLPVQQYTTTQGNEYPVIEGVIENPSLPPIGIVLENAATVDINKLNDLEGTLALLREVGLL